MLMNCSSKARGIDMDQYNISNQGTLFVGKMWPPNWDTDRQKTKTRIFTVSMLFTLQNISTVNHRPQASASKSGNTTNAMVRGAT